MCYGAAAVQVEPLADWHVGSITGIAAAPTGAHLVSCGLDGSIRVWAAAAGGQLVSKRDAGGQLTCGAASSDGKVFAVGSNTGVLRYGPCADLALYMLSVLGLKELFD
jgi:WD40 repeat protein